MIYVVVACAIPNRKVVGVYSTLAAAKREAAKWADAEITKHKK